MTIIPATMRPGVFTRVDVFPAVSGAGGGAAAVGQAAGGTPGEAVRVSALTQAGVFGADSALYGMVKILLEAGVSPVYAARAETDYAPAFAALENRADLCVLVCDGGADALAAHVTACRARAGERVGLLAVSDADAARQTAEALNHPQLVVVCDGGSNTPLTAAAFAAMVARGGRDGLSGAAIPLDAARFDGALTAAQVEDLLRAGVTPFEKTGGAVECIRAVTTATRTNGVPDRTFSSLSAVLAVDDVTVSIRRAVRARLKGLKNNAVTRESIASQITVELEAKRALGVIDGYLPPVVAAHPRDAGLCVATLAFRVAPEINQIVITAEIQL